MVVLIDTNVVLDQILKNEGFHKDAEDVMTLSENGFIDGYISASAITDIYYIARKAFRNKQKALNLVSNLIGAVRVATVDEYTVKTAMGLRWNDAAGSYRLRRRCVADADPSPCGECQHDVLGMCSHTVCVPVCKPE